MTSVARKLAFVLAAVALSTGGAAQARTSAFAGHQFLPREAAEYVVPKWQNQTERIKALAVMLGESKAYVGAFHDNVNEQGELISRDLGLFQLNVAADMLDVRESLLRTESQDPAVYGPVAKFNVGSARNLYDTPWPVHLKRLWQPWVAYTTGWAMFNQWWVWRHVDGVPQGPWVATGRYLQKSILGWANYHLLIRKDKTEADALVFAKKFQNKYDIPGVLAVKGGKIAWASYPPKPDAPPVDGVGPRPVPNNGL